MLCATPSCAASDSKTGPNAFGQAAREEALERAGAVRVAVPAVGRLAAEKVQRAQRVLEVARHDDEPPLAVGRDEVPR